MALIALGLVAGVAFIIDDDDDDNENVAAVEDTETGTDTGGGSGEPDTDDDPFEGDSGADSITGDPGDNSLMGRGGDDTLDGAQGSDRVFGDGGNDTVTGGNGADEVFGGRGDDMVQGGRGSDVVRGGSGDDLLVDSTGADTLHGDTGEDVIISSGFLTEEQTAALAANPDLPNGVANVLDTLDALGADMSQDTDGRADTVDGGFDDDLLIFGRGDQVTGGHGADTFLGGEWLETGETATITDFNPDEDRLVYGYDPANGEPELSLLTRDNGSGGSDAIVVANGVEVLRVAGQGGTFTLEEHLALIDAAR
ncbi:calcium-binding protein [Roseobacteraceae bacterium NS-SX3]